MTNQLLEEPILDYSDYVIKYADDTYYVNLRLFEESPVIYDALKENKIYEIKGDYSRNAVRDFIISFKTPKQPVFSFETYFDVLDLSMKSRCPRIAITTAHALYSTEKFGDKTADLAVKAMTYQYKKYFECYKVRAVLAKYLKETDMSKNLVIRNEELGKLGPGFISALIKDAKITQPSMILEIYKHLFRYYREDADVIINNAKFDKKEIEKIQTEILSEPESDENYIKYQIGEQKYQLEVMCRFYRIKPTKALEVTMDQNPPKGYIPDIFEAIRERNVNSVVYTLWQKPNSVIQRANGMEPLHMAALCGTEEIVMYCVAKNSPLNGKTESPIEGFSDHTQLTPLHIAAMRGDYGITKMLVEDCAEIEEQDNCGSTPLIDMASVKNTSIETARYLLDQKANVNAKNNDGITPLMCAVLANNIELVKLLVEYGAEINIANNKDETIISMACCKVKNKQIIEYLFDQGAEMSIDDTDPLIVSLYKNKDKISDEIAECVIKRCDDVNQSGYNYAVAFIEAVKNHSLQEIKSFVDFCQQYDKDLDINCADDEDKNAIHYAVISQNVEVVKYLIGLKCKFNQDLNDRTPLHYAVETSNADIIREILNYAQELKEQKENIIDTIDQYNHTALHLAVINNNLEVAKILLEKGANANAVDISFKAPIHYAVANNNIEMIELLKEKKADITKCYQDEKLKTNDIAPIHMAAEKGLEEAFEFLRGCGANINALDSRKATIIHYAAMGDQPLIIEKYLDRAHVEAKDNEKRTAVHYAAENNACAALTKLIEKGAKIDSPDEKRIIPLMIAAKNNYKEFAAKLLDIGDYTRVQDSRKRTAIHYAAEAGSTETLQVLLNVNAEGVNDKDKNDNTPLLIAYQNDKLETFKLLIEYGADIYAKGKNGKSIIHRAVADGREKYVEAMMEQCDTKSELFNDLFNDSKFQEDYAKCSPEIKNIISKKEKQ